MHEPESLEKMWRMDSLDIKMDQLIPTRTSVNKQDKTTRKRVDFGVRTGKKREKENKKMNKYQNLDKELK